MFNYNVFQEDQVEFVEIAAMEDLPPGERLFAEIDEYTLVVFNIAGNYYAIADVCSHDDGPVGEGEIETYEIICPRHGARFDVRTGEVTALPAVVDIPAYPVRVENGMIQVGIPVNP